MTAQVFSSHHKASVDTKMSSTSAFLNPPDHRLVSDVPGFDHDLHGVRPGGEEDEQRMVLVSHHPHRPPVHLTAVTTRVI